MLLPALQGANLAARFLIELAALGALAYWGFQLQASTPVRVLAGLGTPLVAAVLWGLSASPQAAVTLADPAKIGVQVLVLGAAVAALVLAGRPGLATALGVVAALNGALMAWWQQ